MEKNMNCKNCGYEKPLHAKGLCINCYQRLQYQTRPEIRKRRKEYTQKTEVKKRHAAWRKEYYQRPEVIEWRRIWQSERYRNHVPNPEVLWKKIIAETFNPKAKKRRLENFKLWSQSREALQC
jgi:predicted ATP-dependent serine protease